MHSPILFVVIVTTCLFIIYTLPIYINIDYTYCMVQSMLPLTNSASTWKDWGYLHTPQRLHPSIQGGVYASSIDRRHSDSK